MHVALSELCYEQNDLPAALQHLQRSTDLGEFAGLPQNPYRWRVAMARLRQAQGDREGALLLLQEAEHLYVGDFSPNVRPVAAFTARVWVAQGQMDEALGWARAQGLSAQDELSYLREFEHITLARVLLARAQGERAGPSLAQAVGLLARLLPAAEQGGRTGSAMEILIVQALAHHLQGDSRAALAALERALTLAEPEGYVRLFVDEGPPMAALLEAAAARGIVPAYAHRLLAAFGREAGGLPARQAPSAPLHATPAEPWREPLSDRELDVLRLLGTELSGPEIARTLVVSLNTVRTHTKHIYDKLGVNSRRAAVHRAAELHLL
jgi:LuxR family maltose regulon positive regulatory protein